MTDRERFMAVLTSQQAVGSHAIVLLAGEDALPRLEVAVSLWGHGAGEALLVTGGVEDPPARIGAKGLHPHLLGAAVPPGSIILDIATANTLEQAEGAVVVAKDLGWNSMLLVASPYHLPRAFLTFLKALQNEGLADEILLSVASPMAFDVHCAKHPHSWFHPPDGVGVSRLDLMELEFSKIRKYQEQGDVAGYADGIEYLRLWEERLSADAA